MGDSRYDIVTGDMRPALLDKGDAVFGMVWPEFMQHGVTANQYWAKLYTDFAEYQFVLLKPGTENIVAVGNSLPLYREAGEFPDDGWDWAIRSGFEQLGSGVEPNALCALSITVFPEYQGQNTSPYAVETMIGIAKKKGFGRLIAPIRPSQKARYPIVPMERYVRWEREDDLPFDPWMRVHARLGAETVKVCNSAFRIEGTLAEWEEWTEMEFPETDSYIILGALVPVEIDIDSDIGIYLEPNVWMVHNTG